MCHPKFQFPSQCVRISNLSQDFLITVASSDTTPHNSRFQPVGNNLSFRWGVIHLRSIGRNEHLSGPRLITPTQL